MTKTLYIKKHLNDPDRKKISDLAEILAWETRRSDWWNSAKKSSQLVILVDELYAVRTRDHLTSILNDLYDLAYDAGVKID